MFIRFQPDKVNIKTLTKYQAFDDQDCIKISKSSEETPIIYKDESQSYKKYVIDINDENIWIYEKVAHLFTKANIDVFSYNINGINEPLEILQLMKDDFIDWHNELSSSNIRKLAMYVSLTTEYTGGLLQEFSITNIDHPYILGQAIIIDPNVFIKINKVDNGTLYLLRGWATGPRFR